MAQPETATRPSAVTPTETIAFHTDPACPWAWRTSLWIRNVQKVRPIAVNWRFFSLDEVNKGEGEVDWENGRSAPALRVMALVRRQHGNDAVDRLYLALGRGRFESPRVEGGPRFGPLDRERVEAALEAVGLDRGLYAKALADPSTREAIAAEHAALVGERGAFGVPTLVLEDGKGPDMFGPVIDNVPDGEEAGELWDHVLWLTRQRHFFEMKRGRPPGH